jgi:hypothetical protein
MRCLDEEDAMATAIVVREDHVLDEGLAGEAVEVLGLMTVGELGLLQADGEIFFWV